MNKRKLDIQGVSFIDYDYPITDEYAKKIIEWTIEEAKSVENKQQPNSKIISEVRKKLNQLLGEMWQAVSVTVGGYLLDHINYYVIATHNDKATISFIYNKKFYIYFQTQQERIGIYIEEPAQNNIDLKKYEKDGISKLQVGKQFNEEMVENILKLVNETFVKSTAMQKIEQIDSLRKQLNEQYLKEWHVITLQNYSNWAYSIISELNDQSHICFCYNTQAQVILMKTPEERDD